MNFDLQARDKSKTETMYSCGQILQVNHTSIKGIVHVFWSGVI